MLEQKKILNILIVLYFVLRSELVNTIIPSIWFIILTFIILISFRILFRFELRERRYLFKKSKWIIASIIILILYKIFDYGNFRLGFMIQYSLVSIPFLVVGYYFSLKNKKLNTIIVPLTIIIFIIYLPTVLIYLNSGNYTRTNLKNLIFLGGENSGLIHFWPFLSGLLILSYGMYKSYNLNLTSRLLLKSFGIIYLVFILFSGYMSGIFFMAVSMITVYLFRFKKSFKTVMLFTLPLILYLTILFFSKVSLGAVSDKASGVVLLINSGLIFDESILNLATSNRWSAGVYSLMQFFKKPITGNGIYLEEVNFALGIIENYNTTSGGHSFFLDNLAFMGILSLPLILFYFKLVKITRLNLSNYLNHSNRFELITLNAFMISVFLSNIFNSWLLFSAIDNLIFLLAGYSIGILYKSQNGKIQIITT